MESSSSAGSVASSAFSGPMGTSYSSPRMGPPPSATGYRAGNSSRTEKNRYSGAVRRSPTSGTPSIV